MNFNLKEKLGKVERGVLVASNCLFIGMVIGFLLAPIKKGVSCGNNNGNNTTIKINDEEKV